MSSACLDICNDDDKLLGADQVYTGLVSQSLGSCHIESQAKDNVDILQSYSSQVSDSPTFFISTLRNLPPHIFSIIIPFTVITEKIDKQNFVSRIQDVSVSASGDSCSEALENLALTLSHLYERLTSFPDDRLGKRAKEQKKVLSRHLVRN